MVEILWAVLVWGCFFISCYFCTVVWPLRYASMWFRRLHYFCVLFMSSLMPQSPWQKLTQFFGSTQPGSRNTGIEY